MAPSTRMVRLADWLLAGALVLAATACSRGERVASGGRPSEPATAPSAAALPASSGRGPGEQSSSAAAGSATASAPAVGSAASSEARSSKPLVQIASSGSPEVVDLHVDSPWKVHFKGRSAGSEEGPAAPSLLLRGHYAAIVYPIYIPDYIHHGHPTVADAEAILATIERMAAASPTLALARAGPVDASMVAVFITIEGAGAFAAEPGAIDRFIARGVRLVGLVHAHDSPLAGSATGGTGKGLSEVGRDFCRRIYRAGALVDVSHMSDAAFADTAAVAAELGAPVVATHSNARALAPGPRNLTDAQLATIGKSGGVAGLNLYKRFVATGEPTLADLVAQVEHMVAVAGEDHVAIGSDFDGGEPVGALSDASRWPALARALQAAGMSERRVRKVFGLNALRVLGWRPGADGAAQ